MKLCQAVASCHSFHHCHMPQGVMGLVACHQICLVEEISSSSGNAFVETLLKDENLVLGQDDAVLVLLNLGFMTLSVPKPVNHNHSPNQFGDASLRDSAPHLNYQIDFGTLNVILAMALL